MEELRAIPIDAISIPEDHLRVQSITDTAITKLADSIREAGLMVRIIVRPISGGGYELVDGERRLTAYRALKEEEGSRWNEIPAIVEKMTRSEAVRRMVAINENRQDLTPFEKAKGYKLAWETGHFKSIRDLASVVGKSHTSVLRGINIWNRFPKEVIDAFKSGELKEAHLKYFYRLNNQKAMLKLCRKIIKDKLDSAAARELANRLDERWLSGDRELLIQIAEKDEKIKPLLGKEIDIADLVNKSKLTLEYTNLTRLKELVELLNALVKSGVFATTLKEYHKNQ